jgi:secondary thiamine-phosphate synthase enzyme
MIAKVTVPTPAERAVVDVTEQCRSLIGDAQSGLAFFYIPHTTAALILCEDDDALRDDLVRMSATWLTDSRPFRHIRNNNPNTEAHILSAFGGASVLVAVEGGALDLGAYQHILLLEMDGPKPRELRCKVIGG